MNAPQQQALRAWQPQSRLSYSIDLTNREFVARRLECIHSAERVAGGDSEGNARMSIRTLVAIPRHEQGLTRDEVLAGVAEVAGLFVIFIVAFTGREHFSDAIKLVLIVLSVAVGLAGAAAGALIVRRGLSIHAGRVGRLVLGGVMVFAGLYTIVHVLS
jgi:hypothetical protein